MLQITKKMKESQYNQLISYMYQRCDAFTFHLPNYDNKDGSIDNFNRLESKGNQEYMDYLQNIDDWLRNFEKHLLSRWISNEYIDSIHGYYSEVWVVKLVIELSPYLYLGTSFDNWNFPKLPEDLSFYSKGKCFFHTIAHEHLYFIYTDDYLDKLVLKKIGIKYVEMPDSTIPDISYTLTY